MVLNIIIYVMIAIVILSLSIVYAKRDRLISEKYPVTAPSGNEYTVQFGYSGGTEQYYCNVLKRREKKLLWLEWKCVKSEIISHFFASGEYDFSRIASKLVLSHENMLRRKHSEPNDMKKIREGIDKFESWDGKVEEVLEDFSI